jgi:hypothetical protein
VYNVMQSKSQQYIYIVLSEDNVVNLYEQCRYRIAVGKDVLIQRLVKGR